MLEKIINKKSVPKSDIHSAKNIQVITRCGTKTGFDKDIIKPIKHIEKNDYLNCQKHKDLFKDVENVYEEITTNEDKEKAKNHIIKEILHLLSNEKVAQ